jgi:filamentous hemagglutinin
MSKAKGNANSDTAIQNNTHVSAANTATIISGGDTNIIGSNLSGKQVNASVGGNLNIASVQDTMTSAAHQESTGGGFAISQGGGSASFSHTSANASGSYAGVNEQAGINAGDGGFNVSVAGNTDLKGAVIASGADASKNTLSTGTLTYSDIQNSSSYSAHTGSISGGVAVGDGGANYATHGSTSGTNAGGVAPMLSQNDSGSDSATTHSGVSTGTISVTDASRQTQDIASLNRDTSNTNGTVAKLPDVNNLLDRQADMMAAAGAAGEAVSRRIGDYADIKAKEAGGDGGGWQEGGTNRAMMQAAGAVLVTGLADGNAIGGAAGAGIASIAAGQLNKLSGAIADPAPTGNADMNMALGNIVANAIATGAGAAVGGNAGAFEGYNVDRFNRQVHEDTNPSAKKKDLVAQVCPAGAQCSDAVLQAAIQAQIENGDAAAGSIQPNYATANGGVLSANATFAVNLYDGQRYVGGGVSMTNPSAISWMPSGTATLGWIFGAHDAGATNSFLNGDGSQYFVSVPTPFGVNAFGAITHAYGGSTAVEIGFGSPGGKTIGVMPWGHSSPVGAK